MRGHILAQTMEENMILRKSSPDEVHPAGSPQWDTPESKDLL